MSTLVQRRLLKNSKRFSILLTFSTAFALAFPMALGPASAEDPSLSVVLVTATVLDLETGSMYDCADLAILPPEGVIICEQNPLTTVAASECYNCADSGWTYYQDNGDGTVTQACGYHRAEWSDAYTRCSVVVGGQQPKVLYVYRCASNSGCNSNLITTGSIHSYLRENQGGFRANYQGGYLTCKESWGYLSKTAAIDGHITRDDQPGCQTSDPSGFWGAGLTYYKSGASTDTNKKKPDASAQVT